MPTLSRLATCLILGIALSSSAVAAEKGATLATVNGQSIPKAYADILLSEQKAQGGPDDQNAQNKIREGLIHQEVIVQEAKKKGIDKRSDVQTQIEFSRRELLVRAFVMDYARNNPVSEDRIKAEYERLKPNFTQFKARHILVEKEDEARAIISKLASNEKFEELAKQSKDPGSKDKGGDLGWTSPASFVPEFAEALINLKAGDYTRVPVKTQFGYHIIRLEETRVQPYEKVKPQVADFVQGQAVNKMIQELRAKAKVN